MPPEKGGCNKLWRRSRRDQIPGIEKRLDRESRVRKEERGRGRGRGGGGWIYPETRWNRIFPRQGGALPPMRKAQTLQTTPPPQGTPVVTGGLWRLPSSQHRVTPGQGSTRRCCVAELLAPAGLTIGQLVHHAPQEQWGAGSRQ